MREQGLNDRQLGEKALVSRAAVYKLRHNDGNNAGINTVYNLAKVLGVRACWLAYGEGPQTEPESPRAAALEAVSALSAAERKKLLRELCGDEKTAGG